MNKKINELFQRALANGVEGTLALISLYYFSSLTFRKEGEIVMNSCTIKMTASITLSFLIRSSSLIGYLALLITLVFL